jgi:hypothetical protein
VPKALAEIDAKTNLMEKTIILCFSVLFTNFLIAQSIVVNAKGTAEVGITENFSLTFKPSYSSGSNCYKINNWLIIANIGSGTIAGSLCNQSSPNFYYNPPLDEVNTDSKTISIPIKWGDNASDTDNVEIQVSGFYGHMINGVFISDTSFNVPYKKQNGDTGYTVDIKKVCAPNINNPTILACSTDNVQISASGYCDADKFTWTASGGTIVSGQGTSAIMVAPIGNENVTTTCTASRSSGLSYYTASRTQTISRTSRNVSFTTNIAQNYMCKGSGLIYQIDNQNVISNVIWNAPNCTVSPETIVNGKRQVTISPNSSTATGSTIDISAIVNFTGDCSATTPSKTFNIYDNTTPPVPVGTVDIMPYFYESNPNADYCEIPYKGRVVFRQNHYSAIYDDGGDGGVIDPKYVFNGITTISLTYVPIKTFQPNETYYQRYVDITVCNVNPCTGIKTCKIFKTPIPDCVQSNAFRNKSVTVTTIKTYPNPTKGNFTVNLMEKLSGEFHISDQFGLLVQEGVFKDTVELNIQMLDKLKSGIYIINIITDKKAFSEKIILNK